MKKNFQERLDQLNKQVLTNDKAENLNLKLQQDLINMERAYNELKKNDKLLRKDYMLRYKELEKQNLQNLMKKNKQLKDQQKRSISHHKATKDLENQLTAAAVHLERSENKIVDYVLDDICIKSNSKELKKLKNKKIKNKIKK